MQIVQEVRPAESEVDGKAVITLLKKVWHLAKTWSFVLCEGGKSVCVCVCVCACVGFSCELSSCFRFVGSVWFVFLQLRVRIVSNNFRKNLVTELTGRSIAEDG